MFHQNFELKFDRVQRDISGTSLLSSSEWPTISAVFQEMICSKKLDVSWGRMNEHWTSFLKYQIPFSERIRWKGQRYIKGEDGQAEGSSVWERNTSQWGRREWVCLSGMHEKCSPNLQVKLWESHEMYRFSSKPVFLSSQQISGSGRLQPVHGHPDKRLWSLFWNWGSCLHSWKPHPSP